MFLVNKKKAKTKKIGYTIAGKNQHSFFLRSIAKQIKYQNLINYN